MSLHSYCWDMLSFALFSTINLNCIMPVKSTTKKQYYLYIRLPSCCLFKSSGGRVVEICLFPDISLKSQQNYYDKHPVRFETGY